MTKILLLIIMIIMTVTAKVSGQNQLDSNGKQIVLQIKPLTPVVGTGPIKRSPKLMPILYFDGENILIYSPLEDSVLQLVNDEGEVEYSIVIPENAMSLALPSYLSGEYELQIIRGQFCFYGYIEL